MSDLVWTPVKIRLGQIKPWNLNPRMSSKAQAQRLIKSERDLGQMQTLAVSPFNDGYVDLYDGHQRCSAWLTVKDPSFEVLALQSNRPLTEDERRKVSVTLHTATGSWDWDALSSWSAADLHEWGMDEDLLKEWNNEANNLKEMLNAEQAESVDAEPQIDRAAELLEKWQVKTGDLWQIGEHRLICGDCMEIVTVSRLLSGVNVVLVHADPPYGMGKEAEGIANDNLYREKLDAFQMAWIQTCRSFIQDNSSIYIWGTADDLWRLWYSMLSKYERLTFRNEIVWRKQGAQGIGNDAHRMYPTSSERCLFFMLGEQGFNVNASNYWEGWTPIVDYLESQRQLAGWSIKDTKRIAGHSENSGCHWFDKSQWSMPTREVYEAWQHKAESSDAFKREYDELKREYDELKREFYSTRAYFDNAHENMTDIWDFGRVIGDERMGHATPKPVAMMERIIKSSSPIGAVVFVPFLGTAPEMVAAENTGRIVYGIDLEPSYCAVTLERMSTAFPELEIKRLE